MVLPTAEAVLVVDVREGERWATRGMPGAEGVFGRVLTWTGYGVYKEMAGCSGVWLRVTVLEDGVTGEGGQGSTLGCGWDGLCVDAVWRI